MARRHRRRGRWWLILLVAGALIAWWLSRRANASAAATPSVPGEAPFQPFTAAPVAQEPVVPQPAASWVAPVDGEAPAGYPVKVAASGIFHVPGGRFYDRTRPERCYADTDAAVADGYRPSKA